MERRIWRPMVLMRREGRSRTFCGKCRQIYRTLFVSNSRNQPVVIDPSQITAYAKKYRKCDHLQCLYELRKNYALPDKIT